MTDGSKISDRDLATASRQADWGWVHVGGDLKVFIVHDERTKAEAFDDVYHALKKAAADYKKARDGR